MEKGRFATRLVRGSGESIRGVNRRRQAGRVVVLLLLRAVTESIAASQRVQRGGQNSQSTSRGGNPSAFANAGNGCTKTLERRLDDLPVLLGTEREHT